MTIYSFNTYCLYRAGWLLVIAGFFLLMTASCRVKYGCPSDGRNVGAERLISGDKLPKSPKFKS